MYRWSLCTGGPCVQVVFVYRWFLYTGGHGLNHFLIIALLVNFVKVFKEAIKAGLAYKENTKDIMDEIMRELEVWPICIVGVVYVFCRYGLS